MFSCRKMVPGQAKPMSIALGAYARFDAPGTYRVRVHYHDKDLIDEVDDLAGRIVFSTEEFRVHVLPRRIELTQAQLEASAAWIREIDAKRPVPLVSTHWHERMRFVGEPQSPEDRLFRAGWTSVPALFAAIEDTKLEPERRAWVFGMLWNILGLENPTSGSRVAALGAIQWIGKWPTADVEEQLRFGEFGDFSPMEIDAEAQAELALQWLKWKKLLDIRVEK